MTSDVRKAADLLGQFGGVLPQCSVDEDNVLGSIRARLHAKRKFRIDVVAKQGPYRNDDGVYLDLRFNPKLGRPTVEEVRAFVAYHLPHREADIKRSAYIGADVVRVALQNQESCIHLQSATALPNGFTSIGTGYFRKLGDEHAVWEMRKSPEGGVELLRKVEEHVTAITEEAPLTQALKAGEPVQTPDGFGVFHSYDGRGNPVVYVRGNYKVYAQSQVGRWNSGKEKERMKKFYEQAYGDASFAKELVEVEPERK